MLQHYRHWSAHHSLYYCCSWCCCCYTLTQLWKLCETEKNIKKPKGNFHLCAFNTIMSVLVEGKNFPLPHGTQKSLRKMRETQRVTRIERTIQFSFNTFESFSDLSKMIFSNTSLPALVAPPVNHYFILIFFLEHKFNTNENLWKAGYFSELFRYSDPISPLSYK